MDKDVPCREKIVKEGTDVSNLSFTDYLLMLRLPVTVIILFYVDYYFLVDRYLLKDRILPFIGINLILILFLLTLERMTAFPLKDVGAIRDFPALLMGTGLPDPHLSISFSWILSCICAPWAPRSLSG